MNYFVRINALWASKIALILLLGLSGITRIEAQVYEEKKVESENPCEGKYTDLPCGSKENRVISACMGEVYFARYSSNCVLYYAWQNCAQSLWDQAMACQPNVQAIVTHDVYRDEWHYHLLNQTYMMKGVVEPRELTPEEVSKLPGFSKYKPFYGGDRMNLRIKDQLLISERGNGAALRPALCPVNQSCGALGQWTIKSVSPEKKGVFTIVQSGGTRACLSFSSEKGLAIRTDAAAAGTCSEWFFSPEEMGPDGEIMSYQIRSVSEPDYALVLDATSQQLRMVSLGLESVSETKEGLRKGKFDMHTSWTVAPAGKNSAAKPSPMRPSKLKDMDKK